LNDRPALVGDEAADAASASLGKRDGTGAEEKNTNREKIPHRLGHCVSPIHEQSPNPSRQRDIPSPGIAMHRTGRGAGPARHFWTDASARFADKTPPTWLLNRMNSAFMSHQLSSKKRRLCAAGRTVFAKSIRAPEEINWA
jgi:hypothetical protein